MLSDENARWAYRGAMVERQVIIAWLRSQDDRNINALADQIDNEDHVKWWEVTGIDQIKACGRTH